MIVIITVPRQNVTHSQTYPPRPPKRVSNASLPAINTGRSRGMCQTPHSKPSTMAAANGVRKNSSIRGSM